MAKKQITPGLYFFQNNDHVDDEQLIGSLLAITWAKLEPYQNKPDYPFVDQWVGVERAHGSKWVLRIDVHQNRGARSLPGWAPRLSLTMNNGTKVDVPDYKSPALLSNLSSLIKLIGARYDSDPNLVLVQIAVGLYGETHPERDDAEGGLNTQLAAGLLTGCQWITWCKGVIDAYVDAFPTTELVIMNAPAYSVGCRLGADHQFATVYPRGEIDDYALAHGVGAQNNSLDEWDAGWFTATVDGSQGPKVVRGSVGPFVEAGRMLAMERGSWLAPFPVMLDPMAGSQTWWAYLNALSKGVKIIFPPNWSGRTWSPVTRSYTDYPAGVWGYKGPWSGELKWMNDFALRTMRGEVKSWFAFDAPKGDYYYDTAQHKDHEIGIRRTSGMTSSLGRDGEVQQPFCEDKYRRILAGPVKFATTPGRYRPTLWYRGSIHAFGKELTSADWTRDQFVFDVDVASEFIVDGSGYLHGIILDPIGVTPPPPPPPPPVETETFTFTMKTGQKITITVSPK